MASIVNSFFVKNHAPTTVKLSGGGTYTAGKLTALGVASWNATHIELKNWLKKQGWVEGQDGAGKEDLSRELIALGDLFLGLRGIRIFMADTTGHLTPEAVVEWSGEDFKAAYEAVVRLNPLLDKETFDRLLATQEEAVTQDKDGTPALKSEADLAFLA